MNPTLVRSASLAVLIMGLAVGVSAQDKDKDKDKKKSTHERLQPYWTQLELTEKQRSEYDRVSRSYGPQIDELETKLEAVKEKRHNAWMAILTASQKQKLEHLRANKGKKHEDDEKHDEPTSRTKKDVRKPTEPSADDAKPTKRKPPKKDDGG